jgi:hypothetical protein
VLLGPDTVSQKDLHAFISYLESYEIVSEQDMVLYKQKASQFTDPARRREVKIMQYQKEKDLRTRIEVCIMVNGIFRDN